MGIEDDIRSYLANGYTPQQIIGRFNLKKSTVYKVYGEQKLTTALVTPPSWSVQDISFDRGFEGRYLQGELATVTFSLVNQSQTDLYVRRTGIQPQWMQGHMEMGRSEWLAQDGTFLLHPNGRRPFRLSFTVPEGLILGEYDLRFGIEGRFESPLATAAIYHYGPSYEEQWTEPIIFRVQYPLTHTVFVSHSAQNLSLIRQMDNNLENFGVHCIIAEDIKEPGRDLQEKFHHYIDTSAFFLAILTHEAVQSPVVTEEIGHALDTKKPGIYLVEEGVDPPLPVEWTSKFSPQWPIEKFTVVILEALDNIKGRIGNAQSNKFPTAVFGAALLAFLVGLAAGKSSTKPPPAH